MKKTLSKIIKLTQFGIFLAINNLLKLFGIDNSSYYVGKLFRKLGKYTKANGVIKRNLKYIYPDIEDAELQNLSKDIWENFGNYVGEFPYLDEEFLRNNTDRINIKGLENIEHLIKNNIPFIVFSAHISNWEFVLFSVLSAIGKSAIIYRRINNEYIDEYVKAKRSILSPMMIAKGASAGRQIVKAVKEKRNFIMLVDQKMNEGISLDFMGKPANTTTSPAQFAREFGYALVPARVMRKGGVHFTVEIEKHFMCLKTENKEADIHNATRSINNVISRWIKEDPKSWFWMHQRWGKKHEMK
jgi:KDO2-lipid IV(A) lauroyltransferase